MAFVLFSELTYRSESAGFLRLFSLLAFSIFREGSSVQQTTRVKTIRDWPTFISAKKVFGQTHFLAESFDLKADWAGPKRLRGLEIREFGLGNSVRKFEFQLNE